MSYPLLRVFLSILSGICTRLSQRLAESHPAASLVFEQIGVGARTFIRQIPRILDVELNADAIDLLPIQIPAAQDRVPDNTIALTRHSVTFRCASTISMADNAITSAYPGSTNTTYGWTIPYVIIFLLLIMQKPSWQKVSPVILGYLIYLLIPRVVAQPAWILLLDGPEGQVYGIDLFQAATFSMATFMTALSYYALRQPTGLAAPPTAGDNFTKYLTDLFRNQQLLAGELLMKEHEEISEYLTRIQDAMKDERNYQTNLFRPVFSRLFLVLQELYKAQNLAKTLKEDMTTDRRAFRKALGLPSDTDHVRKVLNVATKLAKEHTGTIASLGLRPDAGSDEITQALDQQKQMIDAITNKFDLPEKTLDALTHAFDGIMDSQCNHPMELAQVLGADPETPWQQLLDLVKSAIDHAVFPPPQHRKDNVSYDKPVKPADIPEFIDPAKYFPWRSATLRLLESLRLAPEDFHLQITRVLTRCKDKVAETVLNWPVAPMITGEWSSTLEKVFSQFDTAFLPHSFFEDTEKEWTTLRARLGQEGPEEFLRRLLRIRAKRDFALQRRGLPVISSQEAKATLFHAMPFPVLAHARQTYPGTFDAKTDQDLLDAFANAWTLYNVQTALWQSKGRGHGHPPASAAAGTPAYIRETKGNLWATSVPLNVRGKISATPGLAEKLVDEQRCFFCRTNTCPGAPNQGATIDEARQNMLRCPRWITLQKRENSPPAPAAAAAGKE
ncbi:hypothetical protein GGS21DRAFT_486225 [Xylaria nigripes]|nr:hypothetical protein GGS21DRAFT_486225 [Xylaria nigripes]